MAYNQKPETPLVNNGEFGDKIETEKRKKSDAKKKGEHGPKHVRNPDKVIEFTDGTSSTKEDFVRSGERKDYNKRAIQEGVGTALALTGVTKLLTNLNK